MSTEDFVGVLVTIAIFSVVTLLAGVNISQSYYREGAIERGYAEYCQKTGEWAWIGECE